MQGHHNSKKTIYIKLFAGLGNQLFQYSYGQYLKQQGNKVKYILYYTKNCILDVFELACPEIRVFKNRSVERLYRLALALFGYKVLWGFWQKNEYAQAATYQLWQCLVNKEKYKNDPLYEFVKNENVTAMHIRGGDYLDNQTYLTYGNICTKEYYLKALEKLDSIDSVVVFTNDKEYASTIVSYINKEIIWAENFNYKSNIGFELFIMASSRNLIIANSTFSLWAGLFLQNPAARKIGPKVWTNSDNGDALFDSSWIRI